MGGGASKGSATVPTRLQTRSTTRLLSVNVNDGGDDYANETFEADTGLSEDPTVFPWKRGELLGTGSFGSVYLARNEYTGDLMAVKEICYSDDSEDDIVAIQQEVLVLRSLNHPNIVKYMGSEYDEQSKTLYIFTEWVPGGSLEDNTKTFGCSEPVVQKYVYQILLGIEYLHSMNVVHYDIKPSNILIDQHGGVKLADFGASRLLSGSSLGKSLRGTPYYMAPEVVKQCGATTKVDIWSLGCTVLKMLTGVPLWKTMKFQSQIALFFHIANLTAPPDLPASISPVAKSFVTACLQISPEARPAADVLLKHPFIQQRHFQTTGPSVHEHFRSRATTAGTTAGPLRLFATDTPPATASPFFRPTTDRAAERFSSDTTKLDHGTCLRGWVTWRRTGIEVEALETNERLTPSASDSLLPALTPPKPKAPDLPATTATASKRARSISMAAAKDVGDGDSKASRRHSHDSRPATDAVMPQLPPAAARKDDEAKTIPHTVVFDDTPIMSDVARRERDSAHELEEQKRKIKEEQARQWREEQEAYRRSMAPG
ncbi:mitogen-activated protein kinase kinase kinase [Achlya hypogyna]|uniref:Mitogen-activated protein kinase kinase kinase n=1 Tax=Achlya hypogyna TaxID=1202772 RepID=A0A1V9ZKQ2_ACHHY|nr:mitogen-activated protein kinase kinase kinase [Achlya hypogyna]